MITVLKVNNHIWPNQVGSTYHEGANESPLKSFMNGNSSCSEAHKDMKTTKSISAHFKVTLSYTSNASVQLLIIYSNSSKRSFTVQEHTNIKTTKSISAEKRIKIKKKKKKKGFSIFETAKENTKSRSMYRERQEDTNDYNLE
jgi:hypothetical protein